LLVVVEVVEVEVEEVAGNACAARLRQYRTTEAFPHIFFMDIYKQQFRNRIKTWFLMGGFFAVVIAIGYGFALAYNSPAMLYGAIVFSIVMNFVSYWYSDKMVLKMYAAQEVSVQTHRELWTVVENLAITAGLPMPKVYIIPDAAPNAFATGRNEKHAAVVVSAGLLQLMDRSELEGVIAHELSHVKNRDILLSTVIVVLVGCVSLLSHWFMNFSLFGGFNRRDERSNNALFMVVGLVLAILSPIALTIIQLAISRKREFLADASGALITRYPEGLARALEKLRDYGHPLHGATSATAHMFITNPFGNIGNRIAGLFATHPPLQQRIDVLRGKE
jgi:heat shock protein HtpX